MGKPRAEIRSAIVWFAGWDPESSFFESAVRLGGFVAADGFDGTEYVELDEARVWPAAAERLTSDGFEHLGRRLGIDVERECLVVDVNGAERIVINLAAANEVVELGRKAIAARQSG